MFVLIFVCLTLDSRNIWAQLALVRPWKWSAVVGQPAATALTCRWCRACLPPRPISHSQHLQHTDIGARLDGGIWACWLTLGDTVLSPHWCCIKQTEQVSVCEWERSQSVDFQPVLFWRHGHVKYMTKLLLPTEHRWTYNTTSTHLQPCICITLTGRTSHATWMFD